MSKKGLGKQDPGISKEALKGQILAILNKSPEQGFNYKQIAKRTEYHRFSRKAGNFRYSEGSYKTGQSAGNFSR